MNQAHAVALFSGGLDSILAARLLVEQGLTIRCLHFVSPFFGKPEKIAHWQTIYGLEIEAIDVGDEFVDMLQTRPVHGFGKVLNPCMDCKILMMRRAKELMHAYGARCIVSGEVLGQRPMSQRRDSLHIISRDGEVKDILLRPLCAQHLEPIAVEREGLVDRSRLLNIFGRGRKDQLALAKRMGLQEIPAPAGGCRLAEKENAKRYWPVLERIPEARAEDFALANVGRQGWASSLWLSIGRDADDNARLEGLARPTDLLIKVEGFPGPLVLARPLGNTIDPAELEAAAALTASFSPKAVQSDTMVSVRITSQRNQHVETTYRVRPTRETPFGELSFEDVKSAIRHERTMQD